VVMPLACKDFRLVKNMWPRLAPRRRRQDRMRMRLRVWWVLCDSMSPFEAHRCVE
jgi:hypothetical protein